MLLTVDAGNTNITLSVYKDDELMFTARLYTDRCKTEDQYAYDFAQMLAAKNCNSSDFTGAIISSVVPEITKKLEYAAEQITGVKPLCLGLGVKTKLQIKAVNKGELGADLVAGAVGAKSKYPMPCLIWDLGTCTKISVLSKNGEYLGCTIGPGIKMEIESLGTKTSQLNQINISEYNKAFGNTTETSISSGVIVGTAVMLEGLSKRIMEELGFDNMTIVVTGGLSSTILNCTDMNVLHDENLISDGLKAVYNYNLPKKGKNNEK